MTEFKSHNSIKPIALALMGVFVGVLFSSQSHSVQEVQNAFDRDSRASFFKEIEILKDGNQAMQEELRVLGEELVASNDQETALGQLKAEISKYQIIAGEAPAQGEGVRMRIESDLEALWFTDLINELFSAGAEAVSINGIRIIKGNNGFDNMPNNKVLIGGKDIGAPFEVLAIGKSTVLLEALSQPEGIVARMNKFMPGNKVSVESEPVLFIEAAK